MRLLREFVVFKDGVEFSEVAHVEADKGTGSQDRFVAGDFLRLLRWDGPEETGETVHFAVRF